MLLNLIQCAQSYHESAALLQKRISELRSLRRISPSETGDIDERIAILYAEYGHLVGVADYLASYYCTD